MAVKFTDIKRAKADADAKKEDAAYRVKATLTEYDTSGSAKVANRAGFVWCQRVDQAGNLAQVYNKVAPPLPGLPVTLIKPAYSDIMEVESYDPSLLQNTPVGGRTFLEQHAKQHEPGGLDPMYVYLRMITPFRTSPNSPADLTVLISPFQYVTGAGAIATYTQTEPLDLSSYVPAAGRRYVGIYLNDAGIQISEGDVASYSPLKPGVDDYVSAYVLLKAGQTTITESDIVDGRLLFSRITETLDANEITQRITARQTMTGGGTLSFAADGSTVSWSEEIHWRPSNTTTLAVVAATISLPYDGIGFGVATFARSEWITAGTIFPSSGVMSSSPYALGSSELLIFYATVEDAQPVVYFANGVKLLPGQSYTVSEYSSIPAAVQTTYNNATTGLTADTVQEAIDEVISGFAARVQGVVLTGLSTATNAAIAASDSILAALGKLQAQTTGHLNRTDNPHSVTAAQTGALAASGAIAGSTSQAQSFGETGIIANVIAESTSAAGVTVDGVKLKDSDVFPDGDLRGLATRFINPRGMGQYTDHFRSGTIPSGHSWVNPATGGAITPADLTYNFRSEYMQVRETTKNQRDFLCKKPTIAQAKHIYTRVSIGFNFNAGIRIDDEDNPSTNFCELYLSGVLGGALARLEWKYASETATTGLTFPAGDFVILRMYYSSGRFYGYTIPEHSYQVNTFISSGDLTWPDTAAASGKLRVGLFIKNTGADGNPGIFDWFYSTF